MQLPVIKRSRGLDIPKFFQGDAAFAGPKLLRPLERERFHHATRDGASAFAGKCLAIAHLRW
jgi:hypothetical protein